MWGVSREEGTREPWGTLGKRRLYKEAMGITRLPTPLGPPLLKDILTTAQVRSRSDVSGG